MRSSSGVPAALLTVALAVTGCGAGTGGPGRAEGQVDGGATTAVVTPASPDSGQRSAAEPATRPSFTFAAAGDLGANRRTARSLAALDRSPAAFFLALGDLDYDETSSDAAWCDYVRDRLPAKGASFPFQLLAGNHEADTGRDGRVRRHAACLPDRLGVQGRYPTQYAFSYPAQDPVARFVMVSPGLTVDGHAYTYRPGTADRAWLARQLREARAAGQWLVVGMHLMCLSAGADHPGCDSGRAVHHLVLRGGTDLLLVGHNHLYERSKQLVLSGACPSVRPRFGSDCVADGGRDDAYARGAGTVQVTAGRFGGRRSAVDPEDPDRRWFVRSRADTAGFLQVEVAAARLVARYVPTTGDVRDSFVIE